MQLGTGDNSPKRLKKMIRNGLLVVKLKSNLQSEFEHNYLNKSKRRILKLISSTEDTKPAQVWSNKQQISQLHLSR